jgi:hypothetical protein
MKATLTDIEFLIEALQQKSERLIQQLHEDAKQELLRGVEEIYADIEQRQTATAPKRRGRPPAKKARFAKRANKT